MTISTSLQDLLPSDWRLTAIIFDFNSGDWEVTAWSKDLEHAVMKRGSTIEQAFDLVYTAIIAEDYWAPHAIRESLAAAATDILSLIGLKPKVLAEPVKRRVIP